MSDKRTIGRNILVFITSWVFMGVAVERFLEGWRLAAFWWMGVLLLAAMLIRLSMRGVRQ